jgi:polyhydroxybutyrate depolymerase
LDNSGITFWNAFGSPNEAVDDVGFISTLIDSIASEYNIDMNRIYSTGMSNGGFMSYKLACDLSYRIAAIASVTGAMIDPAFLPCSAVHPTPVMQIHGTADPTVPYLGSTGVLGAQAGVDYWVNFNNCNTTAVEMTVPDIDQTDGCTADHFLYNGGDQGSTVEFYRVNAGGHTWPGSNPFFAFGITNMDFSASGEIWRFFSQFELDVLSTDINDPKLEAQVSIYPNPSTGNFVVEFDRIDERTLEVYNAVGQLVFSDQIQESTTKIELSESGIYILTVICKEGAFSKKLVRE